MLIVDQIQRSQLLAKETSELRHMDDLAGKSSSEAIESVGLEQKRLLEVISQSFNAMREGKDIMQLKAFHESFLVLSEIIGSAINEILTAISTGSNLSQVKANIDAVTPAPQRTIAQMKTTVRNKLGT